MKRFANKELPWGVKSEKVRLSGKFWKHVSAQHNSERSELHSVNKHFKSCFLVVLPVDLMKHEFRLFTRQNDDAVIFASFWSIYRSQITKTFFDLGSYRGSLWLFYSWSNSKCGLRCTVHGRTERHPNVGSATEFRTRVCNVKNLFYICNCEGLSSFSERRNTEDGCYIILY